MSSPTGAPRQARFVVEAKLGPPPAYRVLAIVQTAVYEAVNAITKRYPASELQLEVASDASVEAAVAAANHATLAKLVPSQQAAIDTAYNAVLAGIADGPAKTAGIAVGDKAAAAILAGRADDGATTGGDVSAAHHRGGLRTDGHPGRYAVAAAQAVADDEFCTVPSRSTARTHE